MLPPRNRSRRPNNLDLGTGKYPPAELGFTRIRASAWHALIRRRIRPGAGLLVVSPERIPVRKRVPDLLGRGLRLRAQRGEIHARDDTAFHHDLAVDDDRVDVVSDAAFDDAFDRIAHRPVAQRISPR